MMWGTPTLYLSIIIDIFLIEVEIVKIGGGERVDSKNLLTLNNDLGREECLYLDAYLSPSMKTSKTSGTIHSKPTWLSLKSSMEGQVQASGLSP